MQTGSSLLRMFLKKADKGNQVREQPQAFFLPLEEGEPGSSSVIDLEAAGGETEETDLQKALRKRRPDYIAAAEERAGRLSRGAQERAREGQERTKEGAMTRSTEGQGRGQALATVKRSQSSPRVNSLLKLQPGPTSTCGQTSRVQRSAIPRTKVPSTEPQPQLKKSVTIAQHNGTAAPRHQPGVAILRSRGAGPRQGSLASQQHFNIKNIYGAESNKGIKAKAY